MAVNLKALEQALEGLAHLVAADIGQLAKVLDAYLIDGLQNGKVQKFEYTLELCWKTIKAFLLHCEGIDEASPKKIVKAFYLSGYLTEDDYLALIQAIDDRNRLSHLYDASAFEAIIARLPEHVGLMQRLVETLRQGCKGEERQA